MDKMNGLVYLISGYNIRYCTSASLRTSKDTWPKLKIGANMTKTKPMLTPHDLTSRKPIIQQQNQKERKGEGTDIDATKVILPKGQVVVSNP